MSKNTSVPQEEEKQYLLTLETFKHAVPLAIQKLKGNVNTLNISGCSSLERETVAPLAVKHPHSARYSAAAREHMPEISRYHNTTDGAGLPNHTQEMSSNKEAEGKTSSTLLVSLIWLTSSTSRVFYRAQSSNLFTETLRELECLRCQRVLPKQTQSGIPKSKYDTI